MSVWRNLLSGKSVSFVQAAGTVNNMMEHGTLGNGEAQNGLVDGVVEDVVSLDCWPEAGALVPCGDGLSRDQEPWWYDGKQGTRQYKMKQAAGERIGYGGRKGGKGGCRASFGRLVGGCWAATDLLQQLVLRVQKRVVVARKRSKAEKGKGQGREFGARVEGVRGRAGSVEGGVRRRRSGQHQVALASVVAAKGRRFGTAACAARICRTITWRRRGSVRRGLLIRPMARRMQPLRGQVTVISCAEGQRSKGW